MSDLFLPIFSTVIFISVVIAILCIKQKYRDQKACFFVDLFSVAAAGASLVISTTVLTQTYHITQNFNQSNSSVIANVPLNDSVSQMSADISLICTDLGDGYMDCETKPLNINFK